MKLPVLSIKQPWAWLICKGHKAIENRSWKMNYRGKVLVHTSKDSRYLFEDIRWVREEFGITVPLEEMEFGRVIGSVVLKDIVSESDDPWFDGPFGFVLEEPRSLPPHQRFDLKGQPGVFYFDTTKLKEKATESKPKVRTKIVEVSTIALSGADSNTQPESGL